MPGVLFSFSCRDAKSRARVKPFDLFLFSTSQQSHVIEIRVARETGAFSTAPAACTSAKRFPNDTLFQLSA
nr:hypothetical protein Iba_chr07cCG3420 [Ipomoea batatas]